MSSALLSPLCWLLFAVAAGLVASRSCYWLERLLDADEHAEPFQAPVLGTPAWWRAGGAGVWPLWSRWAPGRLLGLELTVVAWAAVVLLIADGTSARVAWMGWGWLMLAAAWIDGRTTWLPNAFTLPLLWAGLLYAGHDGAMVSTQDAVIAAAAGYFSSLALAWSMTRVLGRDALGGGDLWLIAAIAAWLGPTAAVYSVTGSFAMLLCYMVVRGQRSQATAFGPFLVAGALATWLYVRLA